MKIFDRQGNLVFDIDGYDNSNQVFKGLSNTGLSLSRELHTGVYFYTVEFEDSGKSFFRQGYLFLGD